MNKTSGSVQIQVEWEVLDYVPTRGLADSAESGVIYSASGVKSGVPRQQAQRSGVGSGVRSILKNCPSLRFFDAKKISLKDVNYIYFLIKITWLLSNLVLIVC